MTTSPTPATLPPTPEECDSLIGELLDDTDPAGIFGILLSFADLRDLDLTETLMKLKLDQRLTEDESFVEDVISMSQSNYLRSLDLLYRASAINDHKIEVEDTIMNNQLKGIPND
jgi:hypothetical protein